MSKLRLSKTYSARGAQMGRRSHLPENPNQPVKLRMVRLRWVDRDYDEGGAYWGNPGGSSIYCAHDGDEVELFVRAASRAEAKSQILNSLPNARFFR